MRSISFALLFILVGAFDVRCQQWQGVGSGCNGIIEILKADTISDRLYAGGQFTTAGGIPANNIAFWDGLNWNCIGSNSTFKGIGKFIQAIAFYNNDLIVAGRFDSIDNIAVHNIARWDGVNWQAMGEGFQQPGAVVFALEIFNGELFAGGDFLVSGNDTVNNISKWDGVSWVNLIQGVNDYVTSMKVFNNKLVVGGVFGQAWTSDSTYIFSSHTIEWDGNTWQIFGGNLQDDSFNFEVLHDTLFTCGQSSIKYNDGSIWVGIPSPSGGGQPWIVDLQGYRDKLYACGYFDNPPDIARFNGVDYDSICNVNGIVEELEVFHNELYVAGAFNEINGNSFLNIAKYNPTNAIEENVIDLKPVLFPNPFSKDNQIPLTIDEPHFGSVEIVSVTGEILIRSDYRKINLQNLNSGMYYVKIDLKDEAKKYTIPLIVIE